MLRTGHGNVVHSSFSVRMKATNARVSASLSLALQNPAWSKTTEAINKAMGKWVAPPCRRAQKVGFISALSWTSSELFVHDRKAVGALDVVHSGPEVKMMARSMTFCSSRTLPGES